MIQTDPPPKTAAAPGGPVSGPASDDVILRLIEGLEQQGRALETVSLEEFKELLGSALHEDDAERRLALAVPRESHPESE